MKIHILGVCGTFMGGIALLAKQLGHQVSGSDTNVYPPMSTQLEEQGIKLCHGYDSEPLHSEPDLVIVGNALSRGNPAVEYTLDKGLPYLSGPEFLARYVLQGRWVLAIAGTHGKTTTSSMLAWILEYSGLKPGFLIGGVTHNFDVSARLGDTPFFVVEADEYDSAFFDKRSKFVHYRPRTLAINNIEFDHADIFPDLDAIKRQFHHLIRTVPGSGLIITPLSSENVDDVIETGCWTAIESFSTRSHNPDSTSGWHTPDCSAAGNQFSVAFGDQTLGQVNWSLIGEHNVANALAAIAAARHAGVPPTHAIDALSCFKGVKRRMELRATVNDINIYDDFAHHPTAIATTLEGLRQQVQNERIIAVLEPRSNTMKMGVHQHTLAASLKAADHVILYQPDNLGWQLDEVAASIGSNARIFNDLPSILSHLQELATTGDHILIMSNGGFENIHQRLIDILEKK